MAGVTRKLPYLPAPPVPLTWVWLKPRIRPLESYPLVDPCDVSGLSETKPNGTDAPGTVLPPPSTPANGLARSIGSAKAGAAIASSHATPSQSSARIDVHVIVFAIAPRRPKRRDEPCRGEEAVHALASAVSLIVVHHPPPKIFARLNIEITEEDDRPPRCPMQALGVGKDVVQRELPPRVFAEANDLAEALLTQEPK